MSLTIEQEQKILERIKGKLTESFSMESLISIDTKQKLFNIFHAFEQVTKVKTKIRADFAREVKERQNRIAQNQAYIDELKELDSLLDEFFKNY